MGRKGLDIPSAPGDAEAIRERCRQFPRQALHARRLVFVHPVSRERLEIEAEMPGDLRGLLEVAGLDPRPGGSPESGRRFL
jgi:hypothetical protein